MKDNDQEKLDAHEREFKILKKLNHPNIVRAEEIFKNTFQNTIYQVIELIPGLDLAEYLNRHGTVKEDEAKVIFK